MNIKKLFNYSKEYVFFSAATAFSAGMHFLFSIYAKRIVAPLEYGIYSTCLILQTYLSYLQLGSLNSFNRDYPQIIGANDMKTAKEYRNTTFTFLLITYTLFVLVFGIAIISYTCYCDVEIKYTVGYLLSAVIGVLTVIESFGKSRARIEGNFIFSTIVLLTQLISVLVGIVLLDIIGYYALYITTIISLLIALVMFFEKSYSDIEFRINWSLLKALILSGVPLLISGLIWTVMNTIDKFVILGFMGTEALGVYSIAQNAFSFIVLIPTSLSQIFYVKMGKEYGASGSVHVLNKVANKFTAILAIITSIKAIVILFLLPPFVEFILPKYADGILSAQILVIGLVFYAPTIINGNILTILRKNAVLFRSSVYICLFNAILSVAFILILGRDIGSVAYGTAVSYVLSSIVLIFQIKKHAEGDAWQLFKSSILPNVIIMSPAVLIYNLVQSRKIGLVVAMMIATVFYIVFYHKEIMSLMKRGDNKI